MVYIFIPMPFAVTVGVDEPVYDLLVRVADRHEGVNLIVSRHENLLDFGQRQIEAFLLEL